MNTKTDKIEKLSKTLIICKADTDFLVTDTAIQFLKHKFSGRGEVADELLELLEECYVPEEDQWKPDFRAEVLT